MDLPTASDVSNNLSLALALFVATNLDDLFILIALFAHPRLGAAPIVVGQLLGMGAVIAASLAGSLFAVALAPRHVGQLGWVPLLIGLWQCAEQLRRRRSDPDDAEPATLGSGRAVLAVAAITLANGADNIAIYVPTFVMRSAGEQTLLSAAFIVLTAVWCAAAYWLVSHPRLGRLVRTFLAPVAPLVLVGLGIYILVESGALTWVWPRTR